MARFVVVNGESYWTAERLAWRSARLGVVWTVVVGICTFAYWLVVGVGGGRARMVAMILAAVGFLLIPLVYFWRNGIQIAKPGRGLLAGGCFGAASGVTRWVAAVLYGLVPDPTWGVLRVLGHGADQRADCLRRSFSCVRVCVPVVVREGHSARRDDLPRVSVFVDRKHDDGLSGDGDESPLLRLVRYQLDSNPHQKEQRA